MKQATIFLERLRPAIDALPDGADKDTIERGDVHPKQRAMSMRRLVGGAAIVAGRKAVRPQAKGRGKKP